MKSLFETEAISEVKNRIDQLSEDSERQWGKMTPAQMAHHCQLPLNIMLEKEDYDLKPNWFAKIFFKKAMYSDKLWKKNLPTMPRFRIKDERDLSKEKSTLLELVNEVETKRSKDDWGPHPAFGTLTKEQWGKMQYKHLDHHLRQFGL